jgi:hypothetical protein
MEYLNFKETEPRFSFTIESEELDTWKNIFVKYFNKIDDYDIPIRLLKNCEQISIRKERIKRKGTLLYQFIEMVLF